MQKADLSSSKLTLGKVITEGWNQYRTHFKTLLYIFIIVYLPVNVILSCFSASIVSPTNDIAHYFRLYFRLYFSAIQLLKFLFGMIATIALAKVIEESLKGTILTWKESL